MKDLSAEVISFLSESNAIEGVFDPDSLNQAMIAWEYLKTQKKLTSEVILETHRILMCHQNLAENEIGAFRKEQVSVGGREGRPWYAVPDLIGNWCYQANITLLMGDRGAEEVKQDHIAYEVIHPFIDGNGRTGRLFLNWQRQKMGLPILIIWNADKFDDYYTWFN